VEKLLYLLFCGPGGVVRRVVTEEEGDSVFQPYDLLSRGVREHQPGETKIMVAKVEDKRVLALLTCHLREVANPEAWKVAEITF
jgi:hypothetical protein